MFSSGKPHDHCGVFGIFAPGEDVARLTFYGLLALQHRGQESCGIATSDFKKVSHHKGMGLVTQVFDESTIDRFKGDLAVGHTRYSTAGESQLKNAQPTVLSSTFGDIALVHNGHLANYRELRGHLMKNGHGFGADVDSELIARVVLESKGRTLKEKLVSGIPKIKGAFSFVLLTKSKLYVVRDPWGVRPLVLGKLDSSGWIVASESAAIEAIGGKVTREVRPGEFIEISKNRIHTFRKQPAKKGGFCVFEYVYFSRPDSVINDKLVHDVRVNCGEHLARESPAQADFVMAAPDSGTSAALGYAQESGLPFQVGLIKSRFVGRTFISPNQRLRDLGVRMKFSPLGSVLNGRKIVLVDDSIVRGTTISKVIKMLRSAGTKEVHLRIASPPFVNVCYLGVDVTRYKELIATQNSVEKICKRVGADSLAYLSIGGLEKATGKIKQGLCTGCFDGRYPVKRSNI